MASEPENDLQLEIGHVLFIDLVGYSKLLIEEQKERLRRLSELVLAAKANHVPLKLSPFWDPLRGDPRFEKIVADLAPKGAQP